MLLVVYVCVCVPVNKNTSSSIEPMNFIFGGSLPADLGKKWLDFEEIRPGVMVGVDWSEI